MDDCIFCKIASHEIPKEFTYEDEDIMVFPDIHPQKPTHLLIVPKKHIHDFLAIEDEVLWNRMREIAQRMVRQANLNHAGFRVSVNGGGAQDIDHLHMHLMGPLSKGV